MSFEHLDDPQPFRPSAELRAGVHGRGRTLRRRRRAGIALTSVVTAFAVIVGAGAAYGLRQAGRVQRVDTAEALTPVESLGQPYTVLVTGIDHSDVQALAGRPASGNTDTILLVRIDPVANRAGVVSVPRDLWVDLAGTDRQGKVNSASALGGPQTLIDTIEANLGVAINHYVQIDMDGLRNLVDELGGVEVDASAPVRDLQSGLDLAGGCQTLDGDQTLALVRARYLQIFDGSGRWRSDPLSDLSRIERQQAVLLLALGKLQDQAIDPVRAQGLVDVLLTNTTVDDTLTSGDLVELLRFLHGVPLEAIDRGVVPVRAMAVNTVPGVSALEATPEARAQVQAILDGTADAVAVPEEDVPHTQERTDPSPYDSVIGPCS